MVNEVVVFKRVNVSCGGCSCITFCDRYCYLVFILKVWKWFVMGFKRPFNGDGGDDGLGFLVQEPKRRPTFRKAVMDVMKGISVDEIVSRIEPMLRRAVREEVEHVLLTCLKDLNAIARTSVNQVQTPHGRIFQLVFLNRLPSTIFTGSKIEANGAPIQLVLVDPVSRLKITSGPYSSLKVQILVLDGDFGFEDQEIWTEQEFSAKVVRARDGKRPLVTGELNITLRDGVGIVSDVSFTDNSSWIKCRKFRLGAKVLQNIGGQVRIKEAISEAFVVKDHRGELYKKHYPPGLDDDVWRLEKIAKDGKYHTRLIASGICSVKDFMRSYLTDPMSLKRILGCSSRAWESIIQHASTCHVNDDIYYAYSVDGISLLFNSIYKLTAATFDGQNYHSVDDPTFPQKPLVERIKKQAYRNVHCFVAVSGHANFGTLRPLISLQPEPFNSPTSGLQHPEDPLAHQGSSEIQSGFDHASPSTSYNYELEDQSQQSQLSAVQNNHNPVQAFDHPMSRIYSFKLADVFSPCIDEIVPGLAPEIMSQAPMPTWSPVNTQWTHNNSFSELGSLTPPQNFDVHVSRTGKTKAAWCKIRCKIRAVIKWRSVKRMARPYYVSSI